MPLVWKQPNCSCGHVKTAESYKGCLEYCKALAAPNINSKSQTPEPTMLRQTPDMSRDDVEAALREYVMAFLADFRSISSVALTLEWRGG